MEGCRGYGWLYRWTDVGATDCYISDPVKPPGRLWRDPWEFWQNLQLVVAIGKTCNGQDLPASIYAQLGVNLGTI